MAKKKQNNQGPTLAQTKETLGDNLSFAGSEAYKQLRTNVLFSLPADKKSNVIAVTSATPGDGKSTTSVNLAHSLAALQKKVLLIEADMRLPYLAKRMDLKETPGLSDLLVGQAEATAILQPVRVANKFLAITAGNIPPNPSELLTSALMKKYLSFFQDSFDYVILDLPPINSVTDATSLADIIDGYVLVVRHEKTRMHDLRDAMDKLNIVKGKVLGFVLNDVNQSGGYYKKYKSDYTSYYKK